MATEEEKKYFLSFLYTKYVKRNNNGKLMPLSLLVRQCVSSPNLIINLDKIPLRLLRRELLGELNFGSPPST
jgi:hypothetical protein